MENGRNKESYRNLEWIEGCMQQLCESSWNCALTLHSYISVTVIVNINEKNTSIATGPLYVMSNLKRFGRSYLKRWLF